MKVFVVIHKLKPIVLSVFESEERAEEAIHSLANRSNYCIQEFTLNHAAVSLPQAIDATEQLSPAGTEADE